MGVGVGGGLFGIFVAEGRPVRADRRGVIGAAGVPAVPVWGTAGLWPDTAALAAGEKMAGFNPDVAAVFAAAAGMTTDLVTGDSVGRGSDTAGPWPLLAAGRVVSFGAGALFDCCSLSSSIEPRLESES